MDPGRRPGLIALACALACPLWAVAAHADPPAPAAPSDRDRVIAAGRIAVLGATYLVVEFGFGINAALSPAQCRWCAPDAFDGAMTDALAWRDPDLANTISDATGYVLAPIAASGLLAAAGWGHGGWRRAFDDISPVVEGAIVTSLVQHVVTLGIARARPYVYQAPPGTLAPNVNENVSFFSGHTSLAFSLAVGAGSVASLRGYALAPAIWTTGLTLAATTGYLRVAADKHWTTDVMTGAAVGSLIGYIWPRYVRRYIHRDVSIAPSITPTGIAVAGSF